MLRHFAYLDETELDGYISTLEGGLRERQERTETQRHSGEGEVDAKVIRLGGAADKTSGQVISLTDTSHSRFERFVRLAEDAPDISGWIEVLDPANDLDGVGFGALISAECDLYVPDIVKTLSSTGLPAAIDTLDRLRPYANLFGLDSGDVPERQQLNAMRDLVGIIGPKSVIVGEFKDSDWQIAAELDSQLIPETEDIEGPYRVIGKVSKIIEPNSWKPLLALPGSTLLSRERRRAIEHTRPSPDKEREYLSGPALMLHVLALFR